VQEPSLPQPTSPAIPAHIQTDNFIPPVLEASSLAITDDHLNPDNVEIITHTAHQPASAAVTGPGSNEALSGSFTDDAFSHLGGEDAEPGYGSLNAADRRRLSFISFADVVQAEHAEHSSGSNSLYLGGPLTGAPGPTSGNLSQSPVRSPVSPSGVALPSPRAVAGSTGVESIERSPRGRSPHSSHRLSRYSPPNPGELTVETMRQALRRTGSGDLGGARSQPMSAVSGVEGGFWK
jgi:hypothetical protein